jgi:hypothetical protein
MRRHTHLFGTNRREKKEETITEVSNGMGFAKDWLESVLRWGYGLKAVLPLSG